MTELSLPNEFMSSDSDPAANDPQGSLFSLDGPAWETDVHEQITVATVVFSEMPFGPFDYSVPSELVDSVRPGMRLQVPLGKRRKPITGWCTKVTATTTGGMALKPIDSCFDEKPLCNANLIQLVLWMAHYYQAQPGQVFDALIPAGVRMGAGTRATTFFTPTQQALDDEVVAKLPAKQQYALQYLIAAAEPMTLRDLADQAGCTEGPIRQLLQKELIVGEVRRVMTPGILPSRNNVLTDAHSLTKEQSAALAEICAALDSGKHSTLLLHGVTGSGKTEVYIQAIEHLQRFGRQAIVLVPEISLTPQTRQRFQDRFESVAVLHSHMSPVERNHHWQRIAEGQVQVIVGARSAIFAPTPHLGLIVIDEEHDASFKQDTIPRYHARDVARYRAHLEGIPLILGSATPALESWNAAKKGIYKRIPLHRRVGDRPMPHVQLVDLRLKEDRTGGSISRPLMQATRAALAKGEQAILLLNRRGFATTIQCPSCGHVVACPDCEMPLTHHRDGSKAVCHYCDYQIGTPPWCPECRFDGIRYSGLGTQKLEMEVKAKFPEAVIARMDSDTMRRPGSHERVLSAFRSGEIDILLGTQMIAKGLDFPNVTLVGVINADSALHFPDFRAAERTFQLVTQVAGRAGRGDAGGEVVVQTYTPEHPAIQAASQHDYFQFAEEELQQRQKFAYPPFGRIARIIIRGSEETLTEAFADNLVSSLERARDAQQAEIRILGPAPPPIAKLRGKYRFHILLQCPDAGSLGNVIRAATSEHRSGEDIQYVVDIDPLDML
ncbi:replication restart helicase PriA [Rosistilla oblonga]|uniref:replication restart helicase PriA n=1 Tax=Rosistilla oblonga TaxID=2527990 RepID=UPI003A96F9AD